MTRRVFLVSVLLVGSGIAAVAQETLPKPTYGVWMGPASTPDAPLPKGFAPFYPRLLWTRVLGEREVCAFTDTGDFLLTVEAERDKDTKRALPGTWRVYTRRKNTAGFDAPREITALSAALKDRKDGAVRLFCPLRSNRFCLRGDFETASYHTIGIVASDGTYSHALDLAPRFTDTVTPIGTYVSSEKEMGFLAASQTGTTITFLPVSVDADSEADSARRVRVSVRNAPVSIATTGEFAGGRTAFVAALGSGGNGPVSFAPFHGRQALPDTEEEFAPDILTAWQISGRALPFLVTARNIGAEEGTDNPTGRVYLSLYNADAARWMTVWESPALGQAVVGVSLDSTGNNLLVLYRESDGTTNIARLAP